MKKINVLILLLLFSLNFKAEAQFIKKIQKAAEKGAERAISKRVEREAEKMVQKQLEKQLGGIYGTDEDGNPVNVDMESILGGLGEEVPIADQYDFLGFMILQLDATEKNGKKDDPVFIKSLMGSSTDYTGMEIKDPKNPEVISTMVFDTPNEATILFMDNDGEKSSFAYKLDLDGMEDMTEAEMEKNINEKDVTLEKTGNTKDILGYACEEYHVKSEDGEGYYWVTEEPIDGVSSFWGANSPFMKKGAQEKYKNHFREFPNGNFMEMTFTSTDGSKVDMKVIEIEPNSPISYQSSEYPNVMDAMKQK